jgi:hypothetical protein
MYIQHIQGVSQFRLSTAENALLLVAPATTAVWSLERSYAWPPPSLSLLYFLCRGSPFPVKSKSKLCYDRRSVGRSVLVSSTHLGPTTRFLLLSDSCGCVDVGRSLWRENGSAVYNRSHSWFRIPRDSWPYFAVSDSKFPQPEGQGPRIYIRQEQGGPVISPDTGFPFRHLLRPQGYGGGIRTLLVQSKSKLCYDRRFRRPVRLGVKHPSVA